jgi:hypothetical protein
VLNDHERETLREVERRFQAEDPRFTRSFEARQTRLARHPHKLGARLALDAVIDPLAEAAVGDAGPAWFAEEAGILATGLIWLAWSHSARTDGPAS